MRTFLAAMMLALFCAAAPVFAAETTGTPTRLEDVKPIPPEQVAKWAEEREQALLTVIQGSGRNLIWVAFAVAGILILVGAAITSITKTVLKMGFALLVGLAVFYVLVYHPHVIIGFFKGLAGAAKPGG